MRISEQTEGIDNFGRHTNRTHTDHSTNREEKDGIGTKKNSKTKPLQPDIWYNYGRHAVLETEASGKIRLIWKS